MPFIGSALLSRSINVLYLVYEPYSDSEVRPKTFNKKPYLKTYLGTYVICIPFTFHNLPRKIISSNQISNFIILAQPKLGVEGTYVFM